MIYYFYSRIDNSQEPISKTWATSRMAAAQYFAQTKRLSLKAFLSVYAISR